MIRSFKLVEELNLYELKKLFKNTKISIFHRPCVCEVLRDNSITSITASKWLLLKALIYKCITSDFSNI